MDTKLIQLNENGKNNAVKSENNSLTINELKVNVYGNIYGNGRLDSPVCMVKGTLPKIIEKTTFKTLLAKLTTGEPAQVNAAKSLKTAYQSGNKKEYDQQKQNLLGFVIGDFKTRKDADCLTYVPLLCLDIDGYSDDLEASLDLSYLKTNPYVFAAWYSPSGCGLRVLVWTDAKPEKHKATYSALQTEFCTFLNLTTDKDKFPHMDISTSNISRLWFLAETDVYLNMDSTVFCTPSVQKPQNVPTIAQTATKQRPLTNEPLSDTQKIEACAEMVTRRNHTDGRNNFVFRLVCLAHEHGVSENTLLNYCLDTYQTEDFEKAEIKKTVTSAVKRTQYGKFSDAQLMVYVKNGSSSTVAAVAPLAVKATPSVKKVESENTTDDDDTDEIDESFEGKTPKIVLIQEYLSKRYDLRYNIVSNDIEISKRGKNQFENVNEDELICEILKTGLNGIEKPLMSLLKSKYPKLYNPLTNYFETVNQKYQWKTGDFDHIAHLADHVKAKDQYFFNAQFKKMLVRVVACAIGKIPFNKQCLTFIGKQNDGKTSFVRFLMPLILANYIKENLDFDKDGRLALCQNLIINLDELASLSKNDINQVKQYFTTDKVKDRKPYGKKPEMFKRTASFFASTNNTEILTDETGNVRWLVFEIDGFNFSYRQNVDINAVWSQAYSLLMSGFECQMTAEEIAHSERNNQRFKKTYTEFELLQDMFTPAKKGEVNAVFMTSTAIKEELEVGHLNRKLYQNNVTKALRELHFDRVGEYKTTTRNTVYGYFVVRNEYKIS